MAQKQLECRIVITHLPDKQVELGMFDPIKERYEKLGVHGKISGQPEIDKAIRDLKVSIERAGHRLTFCERTK